MFVSHAFQGRALPQVASHVLLLGCVLLGGCGVSPPTELQLTSYLQQQWSEQGNLLTFDSVEITNSPVAGDPPQAQCEFRCRQSFKDDLLCPIEEDEALELVKYDPTSFEAATVALPLLREPERQAAAAKLPQFPMLKLYRLVHRPGDVLEWTGTALAQQEGGQWKFVSVNGRPAREDFDDSYVDGRTAGRSAVVIGDPDREGSLRKALADRDAFVKTVADATRAVQQRLDREREQLLSAARNPQPWGASLPAVQGPPTKTRLYFVHCNDDGSDVAALFVDASNPLLRAVWKGRFELPPAPESATGPRPAPDGWTVSLAPADNRQLFPLNNRPIGYGGVNMQIRLAPAADGSLQIVGLPSEAAFRRESDGPQIPTASELAQALSNGVKPGQTWEGALQIGSNPALRVRLTFAEVRDGGKYARAILEPQDDPYAVAVLEGTIGDTPADLYGHPIRLKFLADRFHLPRAMAGMQNADLAFALDGSGALQSQGLNLKPGEPVAGFVGGRRRWIEALEPQSQWSGKITYRDGSPDKFTLTVAEARDQHQYVRVLVESPSNSRQFRVMEGVVAPEEGLAEAFGLTIRGKTITRNYPAGIVTEWWSAFFGNRINDESVHRLRLLPDGRTLVGISHVGEKFILTRDDSPAPLPLDRESFAQTWKQKIVKGARWQGQIHDIANSQKADVELEIVQAPNDLDEVAVKISLTKPPRTSISFSGRLAVADDVTVNGYALILKKETAGTGATRIFGKSTEVDLSFRLSLDGQRLLGSSRFSGGLESWSEVLELTPVEGKKP